MLLETKHPHPRDAFIRFDEATHIYTYESKDKFFVFPRSASSVAAFFFDKFDAAKVAAEGAVKWRRDTGHKNHALAVRLGELAREGGAAADADVDRIVADGFRAVWAMLGCRSAPFGTGFHRAAELVLNGEALPDDADVAPIPPRADAPFSAVSVDDASAIADLVRAGGGRIAAFADPPRVPSEADVHVRALRRWLTEMRPEFEPIRTEWSVYSLEFSIAGQIDALVRDRNTGEFVLVDWKRVVDKNSLSADARAWRYGKPPLGAIPDTKFGHYTCQLNVYRFILARHYSMPITRMILVQFYDGDDVCVREHTVPVIPDEVVIAALHASKK